MDASALDVKFLSSSQRPRHRNFKSVALVLILCMLRCTIAFPAVATAIFLANHCGIAADTIGTCENVKKEAFVRRSH